MPRFARIAGLVVLTAVLVLLLRRLAWEHGLARTVPGGVLIDHAGVYDQVTGVLLGPLFRTIGADVATMAGSGARVLEVGCGPGHLAELLIADHGLDVTGLDLDPAMVERAEARARRSATTRARTARFVVADAADLPFESSSFDLVVSTYSVHHWADPAAGAREIARVLRPGGRALIWDLGPSLFESVHGHVPDATMHLHADGLRLVSTEPWRWPGRFSVSQRVELVRD